MLFWEKVLVGGWQGKCKDVKERDGGHQDGGGCRLEMNNCAKAEVETGLLGERGGDDSPLRSFEADGDCGVGPELLARLLLSSHSCLHLAKACEAPQAFFDAPISRPSRS